MLILKSAQSSSKTAKASIHDFWLMEYKEYF